MRDAASPTIREALERALVEDGDRLYALALRVTGNADLAADALQDAFATALERAGQFRGDAAPGTWLYRIVFNKSIDLLRSRSREEPLDEGASGEEEAGRDVWSRPPDEILSSLQAREALDRALEALTPVQRAVFELREIEGRPTGEVAEIVGLPAGTVRVYLHRARLRLRQILGPALQGGRP